MIGKILVALVCNLALFGAPASAQVETENMRTISNSVLAHADWIADAALCPSGQMPKHGSLAFLQQPTCKGSLIDSCEGRCSGGDGGACYFLAYELQLGGKYEKASEALFQRACKLGVMSGCTNRAAGMEDGSANSEVAICTATTFSKTCEADDPWGCTMYASRLMNGNGVAKDRRKALAVLGKSCKYGLGDQACVAAGRLKRELIGVAGKRP